MMKAAQFLLLCSLASTEAFVAPTRKPWTSRLNAEIVTELPESLEDSAEIAAKACEQFAEASGNSLARCRVDVDFTVGDETYTLLKASTEYMQAFCSSISYLMIPGIMQQRQQEMMRVSQAKVEWMELGEEAADEDEAITTRRQQLVEILQSGGSTGPWEGPKCRIYFPDEGNAALAKRDWQGLVPACIEFSACGGQQLHDISKDVVHLYFCPKASESDMVEQSLQKAETELADTLRLSVFVNPQLVDMGVTGYGMAGRRLRERLVDQLASTYYLKTMPWGAVTRCWPNAFSIWQEDPASEGGYRLLSCLGDRIPSSLEVEDVYAIENGEKDAPKQGPGILNAIGDFVQGMTQL